MAINGNRILGKISSESFVLCLGKSLILSEDVFFLPAYDTINSKMIWVSATPDNLPSSAESHIKWFVFKVKIAGDGKFSFESYLTSSLEPTASPVLERIGEVLELCQSNISGTQETVLTTLPGLVSNLSLSLYDKVNLNNDSLWSGVWYSSTPRSAVVSAKIKEDRGWAGFDDLSDLEIYPNIAYTFIPCKVQQSKDGVCTDLPFFSPVKFVENWVTGDACYALAGCDTSEGEIQKMFCLFSSSIQHLDGSVPDCNGFKGYYYGSSCNSNEYADNCGNIKCLYDGSGNLTCSEKESGNNSLKIILIIVLVIMVLLFFYHFATRITKLPRFSDDR